MIFIQHLIAVLAKFVFMSLVQLENFAPDIIHARVQFLSLRLSFIQVA